LNSKTIFRKPPILDSNNICAVICGTYEEVHLWPCVNQTF
jgi:hypothetical protein